MVRASGISVSSVQRIWRSHGLQPHRMRQFKLSNNRCRRQGSRHRRPVRRSAGHAVVLSIGEKSQIQVLDRTQAGLPLKRDRCVTMPRLHPQWHHHPVRRAGCGRGRSSAAACSGTVSGVHPLPQLRLDRGSSRQAGARHHRQLRGPQASKGHPVARPTSALNFHFTPASASWLNAVEGFFAKLTKRWMLSTSMLGNKRSVTGAAMTVGDGRYDCSRALQ